MAQIVRLAKGLGRPLAVIAHVSVERACTRTRLEPRVLEQRPAQRDLGGCVGEYNDGLNLGRFLVKPRNQRVEEKRGPAEQAVVVVTDLGARNNGLVGGVNFGEKALQNIDRCRYINS